MGMIIKTILPLGYLHQVQHIQCFFTGFFSGEFLMPYDRFCQLVAYGKHWIQAFHGFLEDHGYLVSPDLVDFLLTEFKYVPPLKMDGATCKERILRIDQSHDRKGCHAFAASRFADQSQGLTTAQLKTHSIHGFGSSIRSMEIGFQVFD